MPHWTTLEVSTTAPHVLRICLNRPDQRNAISTVLVEELLECVTRLQQAADVRVVVLTGRGTAFCAGGDLKERLAAGPSHARRQRDTLLRVIEQIDRLPMPVIAMINGPAMAGGLELALACDLRIAGTSASFALSEVRTVGAFPGAGAPVRLAKLIGRGRASLLTLTGRTFSSEEAFSLGIFEVVVPDATLQRETDAIASDIASASPAGVRAARQLIRRSVDIDTDAAMELSCALRNPLDDTADAQEGMAAWREKRQPKFTGA